MAPLESHVDRGRNVRNHAEHHLEKHPPSPGRVAVLVYSEDQQLLKDSVARFVHGTSPVSALRRIRDAKIPLGYDVGFWEEMNTQGWLGVLVPETDGGIDYGFVGASIICEEMGRTLAASPFIVKCLMATTALRHSGPNGPAARCIPAIASDRARG